MQSDKISIIIACYNDHEYIEKAVQSALDQTYNNKEIIVIDDGSNAITKEVLGRLESKIDLLITQKNAGVSKARNNGIYASTGKYILNLDSDDHFEPTFSEKAIEVFQRNRDATIVSCYANWFSSAVDTTPFRPEGGHIKNALLNNVAMGSSMFKKQDWALVGGYDESMHQGYEDWEFYIRLLKDGGVTIIIPELLFNYRNKKDSRNKKANLAKYDILEYIYIKHKDLYKEHFDLFVHEWLKSNKKSEAFKQQVMDSLDYKIGHKLLKPLRYMGFLKLKKK